jgi:hypothetical protein
MNGVILFDVIIAQTSTGLNRDFISSAIAAYENNGILLYDWKTMLLYMRGLISNKKPYLSGDIKNFLDKVRQIEPTPFRNAILEELVLSIDKRYRKKVYPLIIDYDNESMASNVVLQYISLLKRNPRVAALTSHDIHTIEQDIEMRIQEDGKDRVEYAMQFITSSGTDEASIIWNRIAGNPKTAFKRLEKGDRIQWAIDAATRINFSSCPKTPSVVITTEDSDIARLASLYIRDRVENHDKVTSPQSPQRIAALRICVDTIGAKKTEDALEKMTSSKKPVCLLSLSNFRKYPQYLTPNVCMSLINEK